MASGLVAKVGGRCKSIAQGIENALLGDFRLFALILGLLLVASALCVAVVAFFRSPSAAPLFGLAAAALAASGGALSALWATTARIAVTREAAHGALLSTLLEHYHSRPMSEASHRVYMIGDAAGTQSVRDFLDGTEAIPYLMHLYAATGAERLGGAVYADGRLLYGFFARVYQLCASRLLSEEMMRRSLGEVAVTLYLDFVDPLDLRHATAQASKGGQATRAFFEEWRRRFRSESPTTR